MLDPHEDINSRIIHELWQTSHGQQPEEWSFLNESMVATIADIVDWEYVSQFMKFHQSTIDGWKYQTSNCALIAELGDAFCYRTF